MDANIKVIESTSKGFNIYILWDTILYKSGIQHMLIRRRNRKLSSRIRKVFKNGDWVFGIGKHKGCSQVFSGTYGDMQPFSYLDDFDPNDFRIATDNEIKEALNHTSVAEYLNKNK